MDGQHVDFVGADHTIDDAVRFRDDFANFWIVELSHDAARLRKLLQAIDGVKQPSNQDECVVGRICLNKRVDCRQIGLRALGPLDGHAE